MKKSADPIIQEKESANSAYKQSEMFLRRIGRPVLFFSHPRRRPIVREIIKTAIENEQNLIVEGCYIPFDWRNSFGEQYLQSIRFICLAMSDEYIDSHFEEIKSHASDIETRLDDSYCTAEQMKQDNHQVIDGYRSNGEQITLITENYDDSIREVFD